jgi:hypothetical protein
MLDLAKYFETPANGHTEQAEVPVIPEHKEPEPLRLKGKPVRVFVNQAYNALSDIAVDCRNANAVHVVVLVSGTTPSATISVEGSDEGGANYIALPDPNASQSAVTAAKAFDVIVGSAWVKVRIASISGTFALGQGFTVIVTPYVAPSITESDGRLVTLAASAARTAGANGSAVLALGRFKRWVVVLDITASATDAADTLDVYIDVSLDGTTWLNAVHFTQQAGNGTARKEFAVLDPSNPGTSVVNVTSDATSGAVRPALYGAQMRARWAIVDAGTLGNQSHTFSVVAYGQL